MPIADLADKLGVSGGEVKKALKELSERYGEDGGIVLLTFNNKVQLASNPKYKEGVSAVLNPIREKELTRTILETAAIIAYKQPITKTEIELLRGTSSDYAVKTLLDLKMIYPVGRKDAIGKPILYGTTDEFLKRFQLTSLEELPDYELLMARFLTDDDRNSYLYARAEYGELGEEEPEQTEESETSSEEPLPEDGLKEGEFDVPDFLKDISDLIKIE